MTRGAARRSAALLDRWAGVGLIVVAVVTGGLYAWQVEREGDRAECQAGYNAAFTVQLRERARLSAASDQAQTDLLLGAARYLGQPADRTPAEQRRAQRDFRALFTEFVATAERVEADRKATPLPPIPDC